MARHARTTAREAREGAVRRTLAPAYLTLLAVSFGVTVIVTRVFLALTGYPQVGNGTLHIAHALWGGLALAIAAGMLLQFADPRLLPVAAVLAGVGTGLFIDEVGKFITQRNDYFFPAAAPLIYLAILAAVRIAHRAADSRRATVRSRAYCGLEAVEAEAVGSLSDARRKQALEQLEPLLNDSSDSALADLAARLHAHLTAGQALSATRQTRLVTALRRLTDLEARWLPQRLMRMLLIGGTLLLGLAGLTEFSLLVALLADPEATREQLRAVLTNESVDGWKSLLVLAIVLAFTVIVGLLLITSAVLLLRGRDGRAARLGKRALVFALTVVNVLASYFDVERVVFLCLLQLLVFGLLQRYADRFLAEASAPGREAGREGGGPGQGELPRQRETTGGDPAVAAAQEAAG